MTWESPDALKLFVMEMSFRMSLASCCQVFLPDR